MTCTNRKARISRLQQVVSTSSPFLESSSGFTRATAGKKTNMSRTPRSPHGGKKRRITAKKCTKTDHRESSANPEIDDCPVLFLFV